MAQCDDSSEQRDRPKNEGRCPTNTPEYLTKDEEGPGAVDQRRADQLTDTWRRV